MARFARMSFPATRTARDSRCEPIFFQDGDHEVYRDLPPGQAGHDTGNIRDALANTGQSNTQLQAGLLAGFSGTIWRKNTSVNDGLPYLLVLPWA